MDGNNGENGQGGQNPNNNYYQDNTSSWQNPAGNNNEPPKANGCQIAGLVCGILAIVLCCCYGVPSLILGIAGLICSMIGNQKSKHGVGVGGLVCSIIGLILGIISTVIYIRTLTSPEGQMMLYEILKEYGYY